MNILMLISLIFNFHLTEMPSKDYCAFFQLDESIDWPDDFMVCVSGDTIGLGALIRPNNLVYPFNKPVVTGPCANDYWVSYVDLIFAVVGTDYCIKIHRTWTIISSCHGTVEHLQVIKVSIKNGPIIQCGTP